MINISETNGKKLSGWKKLLSTGIAFVAALVGVILDIDTEKIVLLLTPFAYAIGEFILDFKAIKKQ